MRAAASRTARTQHQRSPVQIGPRASCSYAPPKRLFKKRCLFKGIFWAGQEQAEQGVCRSRVSSSPRLHAGPWVHGAAPWVMLGSSRLNPAFQSRKLLSFVLCQAWQGCLSCTVPGRMFLCGGREHLGSNPCVPAGPQRAYQLVAKPCWQAAIATNKSRMFVV